MELLAVLMRRDNMTREQAVKKIVAMRKKVAKGADPEKLLYAIGLEPDYVWDLI